MRENNPTDIDARNRGVQYVIRSDTPPYQVTVSKHHPCLVTRLRNTRNVWHAAAIDGDMYGQAIGIILHGTDISEIKTVLDDVGWQVAEVQLGEEDWMVAEPKPVMERDARRADARRGNIESLLSHLHDADCVSHAGKITDDEFGDGVGVILSSTDISEIEEILEDVGGEIADVGLNVENGKTGREFDWVEIKPAI